MSDNAPRRPPKHNGKNSPHNDGNQICCRMISAEKKTPRTERKHDVPSKLQSLGKSHVQHLHPGIVNNAVRLPRTGWQEPRQDEDEAGNRGQPRSQSFRVGAELCERHMVSPWLSIMRLE